MTMKKINAFEQGEAIFKKLCPRVPFLLLLPTASRIQ